MSDQKCGNVPDRHSDDSFFDSFEYIRFDAAKRVSLRLTAQAMSPSERACRRVGSNAPQTHSAHEGGQSLHGSDETANHLSRKGTKLSNILRNRK